MTTRDVRPNMTGRPLLLCIRRLISPSLMQVVEIASPWRTSPDDDALFACAAVASAPTGGPLILMSRADA